MRLFRSFLGLPAAERLLFLQAFLLLGAVRIGLLSLRFDRLSRLLTRLGHQRARESSLPADRIAWTVTTAARHLPGGSTCLSRALTAQVLLTRQGHPSRLRVGVAGGGSILKAHAWLESSGRVILGGAGREAYVPLEASFEAHG